MAEPAALSNIRPQSRCHEPKIDGGDGRPLRSGRRSFATSWKWLRRRANIGDIARPRLLSVSEAATELNASEAYVRRLLLRQRLYGIKVGPVWAIFPDDLEAFKRMRRGPGRPRKIHRILAHIESGAAARSLKRPRKAG
jgi:hypothetical protein